MKAGFKNFVLEIGTEEIPARFVAELGANLKELTEAEFKKQGLVFQAVAAYGTCRRLVLFVKKLSLKQPDLVEEIKGPPKQAAYDADGQPTKAGLGFARSQNVDLSRTYIKNIAGRDYLFVKIKRVGRKTRQILAEILPLILDNLSLPLTMRWGEGEWRFIRPVHWILALLGAELIQFEWAGQTAAAKTSGHRYLSPGMFSVSSADRYRPVVKKAGVLVDPEERKKIILKKLKKFSAKIPEELLEETTYLVENPFFVVGQYDEKFLSLPPQILELAMEKYQRYFPVSGSNRFVVVADGVAPGSGRVKKIRNIRAGNEKVLAARLGDARFFYEHDLKVPLVELLKKLRGVALYKNLGTIFDKVERLGRIAGWILESSGLLDTEVEKITRQALGLLKNDLLTLLVGEIDLLEGIAGALYARAQGWPAAVARAIEEHYQPRFTGDKLPATPAGEILALADKVDTLVTFFSAGYKPSGSSDPFALRRAATGVMMILLNKQSVLKFSNPAEILAVGYEALIQQSADPARDIKLPENLEKTRVFKELEEFIFQRLRQLLVEEGFRYDLVEVVLANGLAMNLNVLKNIREVLKILTEVARQDWFKGLVETAVRVRRLGALGASDEVAENLLCEPAEKDLFEICLRLMPVYEDWLQSGGWAEAIFDLKQLIKPVDRFFVEVLVMEKDEKIRNNRLALLRFVDGFFGILGDFQKVVL